MSHYTTPCEKKSKVSRNTDIISVRLVSHGGEMAQVLLYLYNEFAVWYYFLVKKKKWTDSQLKEAVKYSRSIRQVLAKIGLKAAGGNYAQIKKYFQIYKVDISHFKGKAWNKGLRGIGKPILSLSKILIRNSDFQSYKLKKRLFKDKLKLQKCELCGWAKKSKDGRVPLELDHINGDRKDNRIENLRILCPNCHSLQPTHRGLNRGK